jgi:Ca2+:H+ antiporter
MNNTILKNYNFLTGAKEVVLNGFLNILFIFTPLTIISYALNWNAAITFSFGVIAIAPFAERLGFITEQLALHTNPTIGGLLNATFGNATELIVSIAALNKGLYRVVQLSLLGSILSNLLLVLGSSLLIGGIYNHEQTFQKISGQVNSTLLFAALMAILFPTVLTVCNNIDFNGELLFSRITSLFLFILYGLYLVFQLYTHKEAYDESENSDIENKLMKQSDVINPLYKTLDQSYQTENSNGQVKLIRQNSESSFSIKPSLTKSVSINSNTNSISNDEDIVGLHYSVFWLLIITGFIAFLSEAIVSSIEQTSNFVSGYFLATIVLPIIGNAAEHTGSIIFAARNKLDISLGISIGSSTQIALMVFPLLVIIGWFADKDLSLNLQSYEASTLFLTILIVTVAIKDGTSNWLMGAILVIAYFIIAIGYVIHFNDQLN